MKSLARAARRGGRTAGTKGGLAAEHVNPRLNARLNHTPPKAASDLEDATISSSKAPVFNNTTNTAVGWKATAAKYGTLGATGIVGGALGYKTVIGDVGNLLNQAGNTLEETYDDTKEGLSNAALAASTLATEEAQKVKNLGIPVTPILGIAAAGLTVFLVYEIYTLSR